MFQVSLVYLLASAAVEWAKPGLVCRRDSLGDLDGHCLFLLLRGWALHLRNFEARDANVPWRLSLLLFFWGLFHRILAYT